MNYCYGLPLLEITFGSAAKTVKEVLVNSWYMLSEISSEKPKNYH